jgi:hypothetical protein
LYRNKKIKPVLEMKKYSINTLLFCCIATFLLIPNTTHACGVGLAAAGFAGAVMVLILLCPVFLAGYMPYFVFSVRLAREASTPEGISQRTKKYAFIFLTLNTLVFISGVVFIASFSFPLFLCDLLLWGVPFYFYIKGMRTAKWVIY